MELSISSPIAANGNSILSARSSINEAEIEAESRLVLLIELQILQLVNGKSVFLSSSVEIEISEKSLRS